MRNKAQVHAVTVTSITDFNYQQPLPSTLLGFVTAVRKCYDTAQREVAGAVESDNAARKAQL